MADGTPYSARWTGPTLITKSHDTTVTVDIEHGGSAPTVSAVTFSLYSPNGTAIVDGAAASESGGTLSYTVTAASMSSQAYAQGWAVKFSATIGGDVHDFYNDAALCLARLYCPIGTTDLTNRYSRLAALQTTGASDLQKFITDAWTELTARLYSEALPFWRMRTPSSLRPWLIAQAAVFALDDLALTLGDGGPYREEARRIEESLPRLYNKIRSLMDDNEDNNLDEVHQPASAVIQISSGRIGRYRS